MSNGVTFMSPGPLYASMLLCPECIKRIATLATEIELDAMYADALAKGYFRADDRELEGRA